MGNLHCSRDAFLTLTGILAGASFHALVPGIRNTADYLSELDVHPSFLFHRAVRIFGSLRGCPGPGDE